MAELIPTGVKGQGQCPQCKYPNVPLGRKTCPNCGWTVGSPTDEELRREGVQK